MSETDSSTLRQDLGELAKRQKTPTALAEHLSLYFAGIDADSFANIDLEQLHGAALQHRRLGQSRPAKQARITLYTPDFDRHGWHSPHTVIDIITDDMPFLVDAVTMAIHNRGLTIHRLLHPVLGITRNGEGEFIGSTERGTPGTIDESWIHLEIDRIGDGPLGEALHGEIADLLADIRAAVEDYGAMREKVSEAIDSLGGTPASASDDAEIVDFLHWAESGNFIFLGYAHYVPDVTNSQLERPDDGGLGLLRRAAHPRFGHCRAGIPTQIEALASLPTALTLTKADSRSIVHRTGYLDYIGVRARDSAGSIIGEHVFVGLYAAHVYHISTADIPVVRRKEAFVRQACGFAAGSHNDKMLRNILETYPRDELIEIDAAELKHIAHGIVMLHEHQRVRVFLRNDRWCRYVSALIYTPRDRFDTTLRLRIMTYLRKTLQAASVDFFINVDESRLARLHLVARTPDGTCYVHDEAAIEREVARLVRGWQDELRHNLIEHAGEERGNALLRRYAASLPLAYQDQVLPSSAVSDIEQLAAAEASGRVEIKLSAPYGDDTAHEHIKLFLKGRPRPLSTVLPVFENLGLTVLTEQPFRLADLDLYIADFAVYLPTANALEDDAIRQSFLDLLGKLLRSEAENDGFNRLCLLAGLDAGRINILRAYARYLRQAGLPFSQGYVERCLASHPHIARLLSDLFHARFTPEGGDAPAIAAETVDNALKTALTEVGNADDDRILSGYRTVLLATVRTNAWVKDADGHPRPYLSFKIASKQIPFLPKPVPLFEIFVYNQRMEGIHLRGSSVSRGGLRWSDRMEDYRTEGLALVKAQMVKNVVGVPLGAKGCFVGKRLPPASERDAWLAEGIACYQTYIRGLLDLTDNLVGGKVVPPVGIRRHDADDPYLVVAADKGTATFSDFANAIAIEYGFWLGDAFASGGSAGYDHKHMGITARGAWEAVKRHFREIGHDVQSQPFTAVGIGDMSGDVFGNGLLRSNRTMLVAAFDHRHIFLDPNPDPATSFGERQRLFNLPRSSWDDYDKSLISAGGGVWPRSAKSIPLAQEVRARLGVEAVQMTSNELISAILKAPVDLLYNGGIGTYVKASSQSHQDANDRGNDGIRIDATELRAKVVGEGGNLGFTQRARIEYAQNGGLMYTDAIDNSAGVGTSDHEVNIKILLSGLLQGGDMTLKQRDALLASMTDEVGLRVLVDNYQQTQAVSLETGQARELLNVHGQLMRHLEVKAALNRAIEFLPDDKRLAERAQSGKGLSSPEIAVLLAYSKIALKQSILATDLPDAPVFQGLLVDYFPQAVAEQCSEQIPAHPLRREIITTQLVSRIVNRMGTTFTLQIGDESAAGLGRIVAAWYAASELLDAEALWHGIESCDLTLPWSRQMPMMLALRELVGAVTRQILSSQMANEPIGEIIAAYRAGVEHALAAARTGKSGVEALSAILDARQQLVGIFDRSDLARSSGRDLADVVAACARIDASLDLGWLDGAIARLPAGNRWQARARAQLGGELHALRQALVQRGVGDVGSESGTTSSASVTKQARAVGEELRRNAPQDLAMLTSGLAELRALLLA